MRDALVSALHPYGYFVLFGLVGLESLGVPLPGETALVTMAASAALGHFNIYGVVAVAAVAAVLGDNGGYWIGREGGIAFVHRFGRVFRMRESHLDRAHAFFLRHGAKTVFIGRFVALLRTWAAILAGVGRMPYRTFMVYNAAGGIVWSVLFGTLGYTLGQNLPRLERFIGRASLAVVLLIALVVALAMLARWFRANEIALATRTASGWQHFMNEGWLRTVHTRYPRVWEFVAARVARGEYLGLHLTVGLLVSLISLWCFGTVTEGVIDREPLTQLDLALLDWFHVHATPTGLTICSVVSWIGAPVAVTVLGGVVAVWLAIRRRWMLFDGWVAAFGGAWVLDTVLKHTVRRPRPPGAAALLHGSSYSFPSGHAMGALVGYGMLAYLLVVYATTRPHVRAAIVTIALVLVLGIGLSRLYLGVHYFSDVIGGYAAGTVWLSACISGVEIARRQPVATG